MDHGQGTGHPGVAQIGVELSELRGGEHALVDDGPVGEAGKVAIGQLAGFRPQCPSIGLVIGLIGDLVANAGSHDVGPPQECIGIEPVARVERLPERGHGGQRLRPQLVGTGGHLPPSQGSQPLVDSDGVHGRSGMGRGLGGVGEETDAGGVVSRRRQIEVAHLAVEVVGHLNQQSRAVAGVRFRAQRPPVLEVAQRPVAHRHNLVSRPALQVHQKAHPAAVVLVSGVVKPLGVWQTGRLRPVPHCVLSSVFAVRAETTLASGRAAILPPQPGPLPSLFCSGDSQEA